MLCESSSMVRRREVDWTIRDEPRYISATRPKVCNLCHLSPISKRFAGSTHRFKGFDTQVFAVTCPNSQSFRRSALVRVQWLTRP